MNYSMCVGESDINDVDGLTLERGRILPKFELLRAATRRIGRRRLRMENVEGLLANLRLVPLPTAEASRADSFQVASPARALIHP